MRLKKRKCLDSDNLEEDEDFIPSGGDEMLEDMEEDEENEEDLESELEPASQYFNKSNASTLVLSWGGYCYHVEGLHTEIRCMLLQYPRLVQNALCLTK